MKLEEFLFGGLRVWKVRKDHPKNWWVWWKDLPVLIRRLATTDLHVFGIDAARKGRKGDIIFLGYVNSRGEDPLWYTKVYPSLLRKYPRAYFRVTYATDEELEELMRAIEEWYSKRS